MSAVTPVLLPIWWNFLTLYTLEIIYTSYLILIFVSNLQTFIYINITHWVRFCGFFVWKYEMPLTIVGVWRHFLLSTNLKKTKKESLGRGFWISRIYFVMFMLCFSRHTMGAFDLINRVASLKAWLDFEADAWLHMTNVQEIDRR